MKLLLTSAGVRNPTIHRALVGLLDKPIAECNALCIPTAVYAFPGGAKGAVFAQQLISGSEPETPMVELGWKSVGVLELTALPSLEEAQWVPVVEQADVLLVGGGDTQYLGYWLRQSGLADLFASLPKLVYVGLSAGSVVLGPRLAEMFKHWRPPAADNYMLGLVDFEMFPHLDHPMLMPEHGLAYAEKHWVTQLAGPGYAIDDETALKVVEGAVEVISEGHWQRFGPGRGASAS
ncbi:MAG: Type 1 glutamine amidotransferase-like domain-containing protein [Anaerolineales bacterium]|nr:Type 1 glutamine amidotransferase-like domain-containing protein [Anaerolineales bacterium]